MNKNWKHLLDISVYKRCVWVEQKPSDLTPEGNEVRQIARIRTLTVLRTLDARRNAVVLHFLQEADLRENEYPIGDCTIDCAKWLNPMRERLIGGRHADSTRTD